nr:unnamed protein product [Digitaria exilis]
MDGVCCDHGRRLRRGGDGDGDDGATGAGGSDPVAQRVGGGEHAATADARGVRTEGIGDPTGCSALPWARWLRGWTAEENHHGDLLNRYLYLTGRERATFISHGHTARLAARHGDGTLARICGVIAADERRHEAGYTMASAKLFDVDPDGMVRALAHVMRGKVTMPGLLMSDGHGDGGSDLFGRFSAVAQRAGVYTASDYGDLVEHFVRRWRVADLDAGLSGEGRRAQEYVCALAPKIRRMEELAQRRAARGEPGMARFSWIFDRPVVLG